MATFVCHKCDISKYVPGEVTIQQAATIKCPQCGEGMFWKPEWKSSQTTTTAPNSQAKIPFVGQTTPTTCWHAAMTMLADYHNFTFVYNKGLYDRAEFYKKQLQSASVVLQNQTPPQSVGISTEETNDLCDKNAIDLVQKGDHFQEKDVWEMINYLLNKWGPIIMLITRGNNDWVHWVVLTKTTGSGNDTDKVIFHDPAVGPDQELTLEELKKSIICVMWRNPALAKS
jgi:DNA-directed RNA polymerase subunit RPC12/RpoP/ABC-type bacteriocin/lantibiotic exporter with double-glycine peptidase domain